MSDTINDTLKNMIHFHANIFNGIFNSCERINATIYQGDIRIEGDAVLYKKVEDIAKIVVIDSETIVVGVESRDGKKLITIEPEGSYHYIEPYFPHENFEMDPQDYLWVLRFARDNEDLYVSIVFNLLLDFESIPEHWRGNNKKKK